jgi:hypothetical protein
MMVSRTVCLTTEQYRKLWEEHKAIKRIEPLNLDPCLKTMTVSGKSGTGTPFKNEFERITYEYYNQLPVSLTVVQGDGMITYMVENSPDSKILDAIEKELRKVNSGHYSYSSRQHARDIWKAIKELV